MVIIDNFIKKCYTYLGDFMFDGIFLYKLKDEFNILKTGRISKINESGDTDFILTVRSQRNNYNLMLSFSSEFSRIHFTNRIYDNTLSPKSFTMLLRKHIEGYFIEDIFQNNTDRIIVFKLTGYNEMQDKNTKYLVCEIMGRYSNLILTDEEYRIIEALKHDGVGEYNRTILPNAIYGFPLNNKLNPFDYSLDELSNIFEKEKINDPKKLIEIFNGVSLSTAYSAFLCDMHERKFYNDIHSEIKPVIIKGFNNENDFYFNPLSYEIIKEYNTLSELLDDYYYEIDMKSKVKAKTDDLLSFVKKQIKKHDEKILKLNKLLDETKNADEYRIKGELLLTSKSLKEKRKYEDVYNYYTNKEDRILLDDKYTILENSNRFFKKYQKMKTSVKYIDEQIKVAEDEKEYFNIVYYQLLDASINEAIDIKDELIKNKYLFKPLSNKKKEKKPRLLTYIVNDTFISVGKNNIQNEYLTHKFSKPNDTWFHVKDAPGSHVVVHKDTELTEDEIRAAATLASYYSSAKDSSSVAVDYTKIRYIKKIPGKRACFVSYTHQKTIYIDPDIDFINKLEVKKQ